MDIHNNISYFDALQSAKATTDKQRFSQKDIQAVENCTLMGPWHVNR